MNALKYIIYPIMSMLLALSLYQCAGAKQSELMKPLDIEAVYYKELDSINWEIYVVVKLNSIPLDHMYFHGKKISLSKQNDILYSGVYQKKELVKEDFIMSDKPFAEYGNKLPGLTEKTPFILKENECMIGYKLDDEYQYFKYSKVIRK